MNLSRRKIRPVLVVGLTAVAVGAAGTAFAYAPWSAGPSTAHSARLQSSTSTIEAPAGTAAPVATATTPATGPSKRRHHGHRPWRPSPRPTTATPTSSPAPPTARPTTPSAAPTARPTTPSAAPTTASPAPTRPSSSPTSGGSSGGGTQTGQYQAQVLALTNAERAKAGCDVPLTANAALTKAAQDHAADMLENDFFSHDSQDGTNPFDRMTAAGYKWSRAAENIAAGQRTPENVMTSWMNSSGHRANILNCKLTELGVGYAAGGGATYGQYWVQDFGTPAR